MAPSNSSSLLNSKSLQEIREELSSRDIPLVIAESFLLASIALASLLGNILVLMAVYKSPRLKSSPTIYLIISLAWSDLLTALVVVPMSTGVLATGKMFMGVQGCKAFGCITYLLSNITFYTVGLIAFNRFLLAWKPKWYDFFFSTKSTIMTVISSWIFQFIYAILPAVANWSEVFLMPGYTTCALFVTDPAAKIIYRTQSELQMIGGFIIITLCHTIVFIKIRKTQLIFPDVELNSTIEHPKGSRNDRVSQASRSSRNLTPDVPDTLVPGVTKRRMTTGFDERIQEESTDEKEYNKLDLHFHYNTAGEQIPENYSNTPKAGKPEDHVKNGGKSINVSQEHEKVRENKTERRSLDAFEDTNVHEYETGKGSIDAIGSNSVISSSDANQFASEAHEYQAGQSHNVIASNSVTSSSEANQFATEAHEYRAGQSPNAIGSNSVFSSSDANQFASEAHKYRGQSPNVISSNSDVAPNDAKQVARELEAEESSIDVASSSKTLPKNPHRFLSQIKTTKLLFAITLFFLVSWIPLAVTIVVESYRSEFMSRQVELFGITLLYLGTTFNPVILPIMSRHFRSEFVKMLCFRNTATVRPLQ